MRRAAFGIWAAAWIALAAGTAAAQDAWLQIEAQPSLAEAEGRARAYAGVFDNVHGFDLGNGWYGIVLGPFSPDEAARQLALLKAERMIPADSYLSDGRTFAGAFWPVGGALPAPAPAPDATPDAAPDAPAPGDAAVAPPVPAAPVAPAAEPAETPAEARRAEAALDPEARQAIQSALQWAGLYAGRIDGAIGPGTRKSMAAWQEARGYQPTGVLTTAQRRQLVEGHAAEQAAIGLAAQREEEAGIEIDLPMNLVRFDRYQPPFVHYAARDGSGYEVLLISQQGDENSLFGLYDLMQTLEIVPLNGERDRRKSAFVLTGANDRIASYTQAELRGGLIRGFTLAWPPADGERAAKVLERMKASFSPFGDKALDEGLGQPSEVAAADLTSGLVVRKPILSRSGFYADAAGTVVTTAEAVKGCGRITLDGLHPADVAATDAAAGIAILRPREPLAPARHAAFQTALPRTGAEVAVAGYSWGEALDAPVVTFGELGGAAGLDGEPDRIRVTLAARDGDAGGPVLDTAGSVIGVLLPRDTSGGRVLPEDAGFAVKSALVTAALTRAGAAPESSTLSGALPAEDLARAGRGMTVLVSCWE